MTTRPPAIAPPPSGAAPTAAEAGGPLELPAGAITRLTPAQVAALNQLCAALSGMDYFQILKLPQTAAFAEIKKAFYRESRFFHPDRFFHLNDPASKEKVNEVYKRVTEAYYVLRDDTRRKKYLADINGPERAQKLRFTEVSEAETKQAVKREHEEQIGSHPKGRQFFLTGLQDLEAKRLAAAERNLKMALTYEPQNARYKEKLAEAQKLLQAENRGDPFKIK